MPVATPSFDSAPSPARCRGSRRRSASASGNARTSDLEAEVETLKTALDASNAELATLHTQVGSIKKDKMKLENEKIVSERSAKKEIEEMRSKLEDATYELADWRSCGHEGGNREEMEKVKKAAQVEMSDLREELEKEIEQKSKAFGQMEKKLAELEQLELTLRAEQQAKEDIIRDRSVTSPDTRSPLSTQTLNQRIVDLEAELAATTMSVPVDNKALRKLQRELDSARRDNKALEDQIDELHERNQALMTRVPLPASPTSSPKSITPPPVETDCIASLEVEVDTLKAELKQRHFADEDEYRCLERQLDGANKELEASIMEITNIKAAFDVYKGEMEASHFFVFDVKHSLIVERLWSRHSPANEKLLRSTSSWLEQLFWSKRLKSTTSKLTLICWRRSSTRTTKLLKKDIRS